MAAIIEQITSTDLNRFMAFLVFSSSTRKRSRRGIGEGLHSRLGESELVKVHTLKSQAKGFLFIEIDISSTTPQAADQEGYSLPIKQPRNARFGPKL
jgi:hypothetical protein